MSKSLIIRHLLDMRPSVPAYNRAYHGLVNAEHSTDLFLGISMRSVQPSNLRSLWASEHSRAVALTTRSGFWMGVAAVALSEWTAFWIGSVVMAVAAGHASFVCGVSGVVFRRSLEQVGAIIALVLIALVADEIRIRVFAIVQEVRDACRAKTAALRFECAVTIIEDVSRPTPTFTLRPLSRSLVDVLPEPGNVLFAQRRKRSTIKISHSANLLRRLGQGVHELQAHGRPHQLYAFSV